MNDSAGSRPTRGVVFEQALRDARLAVRGLVRRPAFAAAAVVTLALAIGANTAIFSAIDAVLLRPLAYRDPSRLEVVLNHGSGPVAPASFVAWRQQATAFAAMGAAEYWNVNLTGGDRSDRFPALRLTADVLPLLGVTPMLGRVWTPEQDVPGRDHVVVLSYGLWNRLFGADRDVIGRTVAISGDRYVVIGVMPPGFAFAPFWATRAQLWAPLALGASAFDHDGWSLRVFGRLAPGATLAQARAQIAAITSRLDAQFPHSNDDVQVVPLAERVTGAVRTPLLALLGAVLFVLFIACANVAHMLMARATDRRREIALRAALGAGRGRVLRQLLTESMVLGLAGGALGIGLAVAGVRALAALGGASIPRLAGASVDGTVLTVALVLSVGTALAFGLVPALRATQVELTEALNEGGRGGGEGARRGGFRRVLIASEFALALMLLVGAGLMIRTFAALSAHDPGFDPRGVGSAVVSVEGTAEAPAGARTTFYNLVLERLRAEPGVVAASGINHLPIAGDEWGRAFHVDGRPEPASGRPRVATYRVVFPGYFRAMRLPLLQGRDFAARDDAAAPGVVIVNQYLAEHTWPGEDPIGKRITLDDPGQQQRWLTVVGVSRNAAQSSLVEPMSPELYLPYLQQPYADRPEGHYAYMTFVVRTACSSGSACDGARGAAVIGNIVHRIDPEVPVADLLTMDQVIHEATGGQRFYGVLLVGFAAVALVLAAVGIYGVTSYSVSRRTHEIGLRIALGAQPGQVLYGVVREGLLTAGAGAVAGLGAALLLSRALSTVLFGVAPHDPGTYAAVLLVLGVVAVVASYLPARRAARLTPLDALRGE